MQSHIRVRGGGGELGDPGRCEWIAQFTHLTLKYTKKYKKLNIKQLNEINQMKY